MTAFWFIASVFLIIGGAIAAAGIITKKSPAAGKLIDKLIPYQGWIGIVLLILALIDFILLMVGIGDMTARSIMGRTFGGASAMQWVTWVVYLVSSLVGMGLGFLLGFGMINKVIAEAKTAGPADESDAEAGDEAPGGKTAAEEGAEETADEETEADEPADEPVGEALYIKLQVYQQPLGLAAVGLGLLSVIFGIIWFPPHPNFMAVILFLLLLATGGMAAAALITKKLPETSGLIKFLESGKGALGIVTLIWGLLTLIWTITRVGSVSDLAGVPGGPGGGIWVWWIFSLLAGLGAAGLGFLLGFALLKRFLLSGEGASDVAEELRKKLAPLQGILGLVCILLGLLNLIFTLVWW